MVIEMYLCLLWEQLVWQSKFFLGMQLFPAASQTQESALAVTIQGGSSHSLPANLWLTDVTTVRHGLPHSFLPSHTEDI